MGVLISSPRELVAQQIALATHHDAADLYDADSGREFYLNKPWRYIVYRILQLTLVSLVLSVSSAGILLIPMIPCYIIHFFKIYIFAKWCAIVDISPKKLWIFFILELIGFLIAAVFLRRIIFDWLTGTGIVGLYKVWRWFGL